MQESRWGIIALGGLFYNPLLQKAECNGGGSRGGMLKAIPERARLSCAEKKGCEGVASNAGKITAREWAAIISVAAAAFIFNTSEFMPIGLLVDISADFGVNEATGGILITAYAWAVCLLSRCV